MIGKYVSNGWKTFSEGNLDNSSAGGARGDGGGSSATKDTKDTKGGKESGRGAGGGNLQEWLEYRFAELNGWEGGGIYIEKRENRFADMERDWGEGKGAAGMLGKKSECSDR
jgi:hypothetical protein